MDVPQKLRVRKIARIVHWGTLLVIAVLLIAGAVMRLVEPILLKTYFRKPLLNASSALLGSFEQFYFNRGRELAEFLPPGDPNALLVWADQIENYWGQPVAVFVREGRATTWINVPPEFQAAADQVPRLFDPNLLKKERGSIDTVGSFEHRRDYVRVDSTDYTVWIVGLAADSLRWGAVLQWKDTWLPFFHTLKQPARGTLLSPMGQRVNEFLQVENNLQESTSRTGLRAFLNNELLYETPDVDTTHETYSSRLSHDSLRLEYYLSDEDQAALNVLSNRGPRWQNILILLLLGFVVNQYWRWIKRLTAPPA